MMKVKESEQMVLGGGKLKKKTIKMTKDLPCTWRWIVAKIICKDCEYAVKEL